jgi:acyl-CoA reductase-like NAD-dependent aldehyde dehydrogenase
VRVDTDPYSGATLAETVMANQGDLDEAYHAAGKAQVSWAARLPAERAAVLEEPVAAPRSLMNPWARASDASSSPLGSLSRCHAPNG